MNEATTSDRSTLDTGAPVRSLTPAGWTAIVVSAFTCLALCAYQLSLPAALAGVHSYTGGGYDDGVHLATALRLTSFTLPYRDYVFLHPPGIAVLLWPLGVIGRIVGEQDALVLGRLLMTVISVANVVLVGVLLRRRGAAAMFVGGMFLALWPLAADATRTIMLEPIMVLFVLLGAVVLFPEGRFAHGNRVVLAGLLFGVALSVKMLVVLPLAAVGAVALVKWRQRLLPLVSGVALGFAAISLPFFALATGRFVDQVLVSQLSRHPSGSFAKPAGERLAMLVGLSTRPSATQVSVAIVLTGVVAAVVAFAWSVQRRRLTDLDWFVLLATVTSSAAMFRAPDLFEHYLYLPATFIALLLGTTIALLVDLVPRRVGSEGVHARWIASAVIVVVVAALAVPLFRHDQGVSRMFVAGADDPSAWARSFIPEGACAVSDVSTILIVADRFQTDDPDCPVPVDPFGMWLAQPERKSPHQSKTTSPELLATWRDYLDRSEYVVMSIDLTNFFPWPPDQQQWFAENFRKVGTRGRVVLYERITDE
ncbi:MAG: hypothetical protein FGM58_11055 [Acidimicrobiia bacterium]|nr:hypothetical protein [Acidimicrobiia bacterium]